MVLEELVREFGWWITLGIVAIYAIWRHGWPWLKERLDRSALESRKTREILYEERIRVRQELDRERLERLRQLRDELEAERNFRRQERIAYAKEREEFYAGTLKALERINNVLLENHTNSKEAGELLRQVATDVAAVRNTQNQNLMQTLLAVRGERQQKQEE